MDNFFIFRLNLYYFDNFIDFEKSTQIISTATFQNSFLGFQKLSAWVEKHSKNASVVHFCIEATGIYHEEIAEFIYNKKKFIVSVVNPFQSKAFAQSRLLRTKNDKVDANLLALYCAISRPKFL
jgi:transposase